MTDLPAKGFMSNSGRTQQNMKDAFENQRDFIAEGWGANAQEARTINAGAITPSRAHHTVDTEGGASSDDLASIALSLPDGRLLVLEPADSSRRVTIKHLAGGSGEIETIAGHDILLQNRSRLILERSGSRWRQVFETQLPGGATGTYDNFAGTPANIPPRAVHAIGQTLAVSEHPELAARCPNLVSGNDILVPDTRERVFVGVNSAASPSSRINSAYLNTSAVGNTGGQDELTLAASQVPLRDHTHGNGSLGMPSHSHSFGGSGGTSGDTHDHDLPSAMVRRQSGSFASSSGNHLNRDDNLDTSNDTHSHTFSISGNTGSRSGDITGSTDNASAAASAPVGLVQPSIVACAILWL